ncbi:methionine adenosyltransferase [Mycoplasmopsis lipophila]|uniref:methionine adenosyltransferase n=1 Tax=Mycoplasmopsis lipophila TaxID=2117 RepID=UPI003873851C
MQKILFTSESVGQGHPDKICDQISDTILDSFLKEDPYSRTAIETVATGNKLVIAGEYSSKAKNVNVKEIAINVLKKLNYYQEDLEIIIDLKPQSTDIAQGVILNDNEIGAGDQGIMFGYATNETPNYMPLAITLAHEIVKLADKKRISGEFKWAKADMKSQVTIDYSNLNKTQIDTILFSCQHDEHFNENEFKTYIKEQIFKPVCERYGLNIPKNIYINPTGRFVIGGPIGDTGLTGRKIIVDTYGGSAHHGGGAFSGKDATKVDRSAAYVSRWIAKNLVAAGIASKLEIQVSYAIGVAKPISISVNTFNTSKYSNEIILKIINKVFDLRPYAIIKELDLRKPIFAQTSYFGHFGRDDLNLPWEQLNKVEAIKKILNK